MSVIATALRKTWKNPDDWQLNRYTATHKSGVELWIANGAWFFDFHAAGSSIGLLERHWLWREFNWAMRGKRKRVENAARDKVLRLLTP